jgi:hypothetical protein
MSIGIRSNFCKSEICNLSKRIVDFVISVITIITKQSHLMRKMTEAFNCQGSAKATSNKQNQQEFSQAAHGQSFSHIRQNYYL